MVDGKSQPWRKIAAIFAIVIIGGSLGISWWFLQFAGVAARGDTGESVVVFIGKGSSVKEINAILAEPGLVRYDIRFVLLARFMGVGGKLQAGEFALHRGQTPGELLRELATAKPLQHKVTIPEGLVIDEIAQIFAAGGWCSREEYNRLAADQVFIKSLGVEDITTLEGYLFPDTYNLTRKEERQGAEELIRMQLRRFFSVWDDVAAGIESELSPYQVLTLASMVEEETGHPEERPLIAGVFLNRIRKGMRLQSDPTVIYGIKNFSGNLTRTQLRTSTPYNTYTLKGLPAGPICNPGRLAIEAVLQPAATKYLYFVSMGGGRHHFSTTLREHNRAVNKYQR